MISVYPAFYKDFRCKADRCVHSCCIQNWDIDIDEATAMKYLVMTGEPGETIRASMTGTKGNRRFIMKDGRCPLLQEDGLCRIIAETGEENLCDICAMHPRFFVETEILNWPVWDLPVKKAWNFSCPIPRLCFHGRQSPFSIRLSHAAFRYGLQPSRRSALLYADHQ